MNNNILFQDEQMAFLVFIKSDVIKIQSSFHKQFPYWEAKGTTT